MNVRFGSKADMTANPPNVRFTPKSGHSAARSRCPALCQKQTLPLIRTTDYPCRAVFFCLVLSSSLAPLYNYAAPAYGYATPVADLAPPAYGYTAPSYGYAAPAYAAPATAGTTIVIVTPGAPAYTAPPVVGSGYYNYAPGYWGGYGRWRAGYWGGYGYGWR